jgi:importin-4
MEYPASPSSEQLALLLGQIISGQNSQELEKYFKRYLKLSQCVPDLMEQMMTNPQSNVRQLASVLLRKRIMKHWQSLTPDIQTKVKTALIDRIVNESESLVRKNVASLTATLASNILADWPELLTFISTCTDSNVIAAKEIGLYLLAELLENPEICTFLKPHQEKLMNLFSVSLADGSSREIRKNALKALGNHAANSEEESSVNYILTLIPKIAEVLSECVDSLDEELIVFAFEVFDSLIDSGQDITSNIELLIKIGIEKVGINTSLQLSTRECALDFLETVADMKPKVITSSPEFVRYILTHVFTIAVECDDNSEEASPVDMALRLLDTLALNLPNKTVYPHVMELTTQLRNSSNPRHRKIGVLALGVVAEGCADYVKQDLSLVVNLLLQALVDPDVGVREGAGLAIGYCSEHLKPDILDLHSIILPQLIGILDFSNTRVKQKGLYAIDIFCEYFDDDIEQYLPSLVSKLIALIVYDADTKVKEMAISALTSAISSAEQKITSYFTPIIKILGEILQSPEKEMGLKASALQCLGTLASSSTTELFAPYLQDSLSIAFNFLSGEILEFREAGFAFFYSLSKLLKENIAPYADQILDQALKSCETQEGNKIEVTEDSDSEDEGLEGVYKVRTVFLDEKTAALHTLGNLAIACPGKVIGHMERIDKNLDILFDYFHENIRMQCVTTSQQLIEGFVQLPGGISNVHDFWYTKVIHRYIEYISEDESKEVVIRVLEAFEELVKKIGVSLIPDNTMPLLVDQVLLLLGENASCQKQVDDNEGDHDESLMGDLCDMLIQIVKEWKESFSSHFEKLLPGIEKFTRAERNTRDRILFTGLLADTLKHMPSLVVKYPSNFAILVERNLTGDDVSLYRNTLYYLGIISEAAPSLSSSYTRFLQLLQPFFTSEFEPATIDNAVAAVCRMIITSPQSLPLETVLPAVYGKLPLKDDFDEYKTIVRFIVFLYHSGINLDQFTETNIRILMEGLIVQVEDPDKYKIDNETALKATQVLISLKTSPSFQSIASALTPESQLVLTKILQG